MYFYCFSKIARMGSIDRGSRATQRYSTGWRSAEQDSRPGNLRARE